jgi:branched-chain amino acid transport system permease protein
LRISGDYLVIASIGFQLSVIQIIKNLDITGGPGGLAGIPPLLPTISIAGSAIVIAVVWLGVLASALLLRWLVGGGYGLSIAAMRDDEAALAGLGRSTMRIKVTLFATACAIAGVAGGIYAHYFQYISPDQFDIAYSAAILTMVVVGGVRTVWGPVLGAVLLQALPQVIRFIDMPSSVLGSVQGLIYTGLVLLFLFVRPGGILGASNELRLSTFSDDDAEQAV